MNFDMLEKACFDIWMSAVKGARTAQTIAVLGPPGVGKTSTGRALAVRMTEEVQKRNPDAEPAQCRVLDLSSMMPEDLMGLPYRDGSVTRYCPQSWLAPLCQKHAYGVLILDDLPAAPVQVQVAARQVSLERRIHDMHLADGVFVLVTGNRREDKSAAATLPAHFRNSVVLLTFEPDFKGWERWYMAQDLDVDIPAFLHYKPEHFSRLPKDADQQGAFATPRSWAMLGNLAKVVNETAIAEVAAGLVGQGVSTEFAAFRLVRRELVSPEQVMADPESAMPNPERLLGTPDRLIAMTTGLGEVAARKSKGKPPKEAVEILGRYLRALGHITDHKREWTATSVTTFVAAQGSIKHLLDAAGYYRSRDPKVAALLNYLGKALEVDK